MQKVVLKLDIHRDGNCKQRAMKMVSATPGLESISLDMIENKMTVTGQMDALEMVMKLRKVYNAEIISVGPAKEPEKKEVPKMKEEPKKQAQMVQFTEDSVVPTNEPEKEDEPKNQVQVTEVLNCTIDRANPQYLFPISRFFRSIGIRLKFYTPHQGLDGLAKEPEKKEEPKNQVEVTEVPNFTADRANPQYMFPKSRIFSSVGMRLKFRTTHQDLVGPAKEPEKEDELKMKEEPKNQAQVVQATEVPNPTSNQANLRYLYPRSTFFSSIGIRLKSDSPHQDSNPDDYNFLGGSCGFMTGFLWM